jgi:HK97 family phage portal protein
VATWYRPTTWFARGRSLPQVISRVVSSWQVGKALPHTFDIKAFADEGYRKNLIVNACIVEILSSASEPELYAAKVAADGSETRLDRHHPLSVLLRRPNPEYSQAELLERMMLHAHVGGQWFLHKLRAPRGNIVELWPLRPDRVLIVPGANGLIERFDFKRTDTGSKTPLAAADVIQGILRPDYLDDFGALPPMAAAARWIDLDNEAADYLRAFFTNGGQPSALLKFKHQTEEKDRQRTRELWKERYGAGNWHDVAVIDGDWEYVEVGSRPGKLAMDAIFDQTETRICAAFNVPPIIIAVRIGLLRSTYSNYREAKSSWWDEGMSPLYRRIADKLTVGVGHEFGPDIVIRFDFSRVKALQEDQQQKRADAGEGWMAGILTLDQALEMWGLPKVGGADGEKRRAFGGGAGAFPLDELFFVRAMRERHAAARGSQGSLEKLFRGHFSDQGKALEEHVRAALAQIDERSRTT